ncbi:MAG: hypothetical protein ABSG60_17225 [Terracidiphilus sp.]|jgi:hypothetical protein
MLAALAAPAPAAADRGPTWSDDGLEDDVATLSYEHALRAHARYRPVDDDDRSLTQIADPGPIRNRESLPAAAIPTAPAATPYAAVPTSVYAEPEAARGLATELDRTLKCASITIRLSKAECAQLHRRAAEAGLTVSAYLRSCTFEAESLRTLVKETLAELRSAASKGKQTCSAPPRRSWFQRLLQAARWDAEWCCGRR